MTLADAIQSIPDWQTKTAQQVLASLHAVTETKTDSQLYTYAGIVLLLGSEAGLGFRATLKALTAPSNPAELPVASFEALDFAHARLEGPGLDLSLPAVQSILDGLSAVPQLAPFVGPIKSIGVNVTHPYQSTTLAEVQFVFGQLQLDATKSTMRIEAAGRYNAYVSALDGWDGSGNVPVL